MEESLVKRLMASVKCAVCGQHYKVDDISVLGHQDDLWFLGAFCSACHTQCLVAALIKEGRAPEVAADFTEAELDKFRNVAGLTQDDALDMHNFLKDFDGDFLQLFGQKQA